MRAVEMLVTRLARLLAWMGGIALLLMMLQTVGDLILARVFGRPVEGNMEVVSAYHMVLAVFLPLAIVELRHEHISADLFVQMMPLPLKRAIYVFGGLVSFGFFGILCYQTWMDALESLRINEVLMGSIYIPVWPPKFALPIGFGAMLLVILLHMFKAITDPAFDPVPRSPELNDDGQETRPAQ